MSIQYGRQVKVIVLEFPYMETMSQNMAINLKVLMQVHADMLYDIAMKKVLYFAYRRHFQNGRHITAKVALIGLLCINLDRMRKIKHDYMLLY